VDGVGKMQPFVKITDMISRAHEIGDQPFHRVMRIAKGHARQEEPADADDKILLRWIARKYYNRSRPFVKTLTDAWFVAQGTHPVYPATRGNPIAWKVCRFVATFS
jgi:hypothetical protein